MNEFHAWIGLSESTEESDLGGLQDAVVELQELAADSKWHDAVFEVRNLNGQYFVTAEGMVNRRREEGERLDLFLAIIARKLPGSWGLIYERDDEMPDPPGPNAFRVRVLARGRITERPDPFLSPCNPVIEDLKQLNIPARQPVLAAPSRGNRHPAGHLPGPGRRRHLENPALPPMTTARRTAMAPHRGPPRCRSQVAA